MSAEADVAEMQSLLNEIAARIARGRSVQERITALMGKLGFGANRTLEFLRGKARVVQSWEKDHARAALADLKRAERQRRDLDHLAWLASEVGRLEASGEAFHGAHVDGLKHFLRLARGEGGAVALPGEADDGTGPG